MEQIIIHHPNGTARPLCDRKTATTITSAKQKREINNGDTVTMNIKSTNPQDFNIGDWIEIFGRVYRLNRLPKVKKDGEFGYSYDLEFEGVQYDLMRAMYNVNIDTTDNTIQDVTGDSLTGNLRRFLDVLVANANRVFPGVWSIGECPNDTDGDVTMTFGESDNCLAVLQSLCDKFKTEFDIDTADGIHFAIHMGKVGRTLPHAFIYGRGGGLYEITRENVSSSNVVTRLYAFGSTENITCKYRGTRLMMPGCTKATSFIENADALAIYGVCEATKYFDEKPTHTGTVTAVVNGDSLSFVDADFPFDINERDGVTTKYLIDGVAAKIHFNSGNLAGFEFEIHKYDHATHTFTLVKQTDERGNVFPSPTSAAFQIAQGNTYKIIDIAYPDTITQAAEQRLKATATESLDQNCQPKVKYSVGITKQWLQRHASDAGVTNYFMPGDYVTVVDTGIGVNKTIRINAFERDILDPYNYKLTISDTVTTQLITRVISDAIETDKCLELNDLKNPARARANWRSSREVLNMVFDPEGDYYTDKIKPESIDTVMLSVGAKSMQFSLVGVTISANYQGNPNVLQISQGQLVHYAIEEQPRTWEMSPISVSNLNSAKAYYIYAQVTRNGMTGKWFITESKIPYNRFSQTWTFLVGVLNSVEATTNTRTIYTMYGFTTINGRFIRTGRIQSADGNTYFDLDAGEIGGKITFKRNDGTTGNVADLDASNQDAQDYINNTLPGMFGDLYDQIDGKIDTWYQETDPSSAWTTNTERAKHVGDMWYKASANELKRYSSTYAWDLITDATAIAAYQAASQAQDTADGKRRVFTRQPTAADEYDEGDLWVNATCGQYVDELLRAIRHKDAGVAFSLSHWTKATRYTDNSELDNFINNTFNQVVADIQSQLDGQIEQFFETYDPTLQNEPATSWNAQEKENHLGDLFYNTENGKVFRFVKENGTYKWMQLQDEELAQALVLAQNAWDLADRKRTIFSSQPVPPYDIADLWVQGIDGDIMICIQARAMGSFVASDWTKASKYTDDTALNNFVNTTFVNAINTLTTQIDRKIETWFTSTDPSSAWTTNAIRDLHIDDIWYNTSAKTLWHYVKVGKKYKWEQIVDQATIDAYEAASHAQDTADGKRRVFTDTPVPPYDAGDLWVQGGNGDIMVCVTPRAEGQSHNPNDWKKASKYTDDSALRSFIDTTFTNAIGNLTEQIDGKIETWFMPTNPAAEWETGGERAKHVDDIWYNTAEKTLWHYTRTQRNSNGTTIYFYQWEQIVDQATIDAYDAASHAQDTADGKRRVFTDTPVPPYDAGDLWVQGGNGDIMVCRTTRTSGAYNASDWVKASKYTDDAALNDFISSTFNPAISNLSSQIDGKIEVWFTNVDPSTAWTTPMAKKRHVDDIWYNTTEKTLWHYKETIRGQNSGITTYIYAWVQMTDAQAIAAYEAASAAQDTADGKRTVFVAQPTNEDAYEPGDLWVNCNYNANGVTYHNDLLRCVTKKAAGAAFSITHWALATAYDNTKTTIDGGVVTSGTIRLAGDDTTIKAGITGNGTGDESIRIWAGATEENKAVAPFRVYQDGSFVANNATITGIINAITGNIGNLRINGNYLSGYDGNGNERVRIGIGDLPSTSAAFVTQFVKFDIQSDDQDAHIVGDGQNGGWVQRIGHWDYSGQGGHDVVEDTYISFYTEFRITETPTKLVFEDICLTSPSSSGVIETIAITARLKFRANTSSAWTTLATTYDPNILCQNGRWEISHGTAGYFRLEVSGNAYPQLDTVWQGVLQLGCRGIIVTLSPSVSLPNMTMIASDGILCTQGTNKYMRFSGSVGFEVRNGNQGFRVTSSGVQKLITSTGGSQTWKDVLPTS